VAEWIAQVSRNGPRSRVVVEGFFSFDTDQLDGIEERTAQEMVEHLRKFFPRRAPPREDPSAEMFLEIDIAVEPS
jgi:hypothetical protein